MNDQHYDYRDWLETIDLRALSDSSLKIGHQTREVLGDAYLYFPDVLSSDDMVASVDLWSGQSMMVSESCLVRTHFRCKDLCLEQLYLIPKDDIDPMETNPNASHEVLPGARHARAVDYLSHAVTQFINLRAIETFQERTQVECTHGAAWDADGAPLSLLSRLHRETLLKDPFQDSRIFNYTSTPTVASQPITVLLKRFVHCTGAHLSIWARRSSTSSSTHCHGLFANMGLIGCGLDIQKLFGSFLKFAKPEN